MTLYEIVDDWFLLGKKSFQKAKGGIKRGIKTVTLFLFDRLSVSTNFPLNIRKTHPVYIVGDLNCFKRQICLFMSY